MVIFASRHRAYGLVAFDMNSVCSTFALGFPGSLLLMLFGSVYRIQAARANMVQRLEVPRRCESRVNGEFAAVNDDKRWRVADVGESNEKVARNDLSRIKSLKEHVCGVTAFLRLS